MSIRQKMALTYCVYVNELKICRLSMTSCNFRWLTAITPIVYLMWNASLFCTYWTLNIYQIYCHAIDYTIVLIYLIYARNMIKEIHLYVGQCIFTKMHINIQVWYQTIVTKVSLIRFNHQIILNIYLWTSVNASPKIKVCLK